MTSVGNENLDSMGENNGLIHKKPIFSCCNQCIVRLVSICGTLDDNDLHQLSEISTQLIKLPKQTIYREGDAAEYLYNIRSGCVLMSKMLADGRRQIIDFLFAGDFFGFPYSDDYSYTVEAVTNVDVCLIPRQKINNKINKFPKLGRKLLDIASSKLQTSQDQILLLGRKKAKEKLCSFILSMANKTTKINDLPTNMTYLPMGRSDIADYLGLTIETVSRQFTILSKDKIISIDGSPNVTILDKKRMMLIASGQ